jgi:hypothetical protein
MGSQLHVVDSRFSILSQIKEVQSERLRRLFLQSLRLLSRLDAVAALPLEFYDGTDCDDRRIYYYERLYQLRAQAFNRVRRRFETWEDSTM